MLNFILSQNPLGISLDDDSIKIAQIKNTGELRVFNSINLPKGSIAEGKIIKEDDVIKSIKELLKTSNKLKKITTKEVICVLPEKKTYLKIITITDPEKNIKKLEEQIKTELAKYIPAEFDTLYIDWRILTAKKEILNNIQILVGAGPKKLIKSYTSALEKSGLLPISLELESIAISRAMIPKNLKDKTFGVLNIEKKSSLFILYNNGVKFSIVLPFAEDKITNLISSSLNITIQQAKKAQNLCGLNTDKARGAVKQILDPFLSNLTQKIKDIESYNKNYCNGGKLDEILICGNITNLQGLDKFIEETLKIKTTVGDPAANININKNKNLNKKQLQSYIPAIGLALNKILLNKK